MKENPFVSCRIFHFKWSKTVGHRHCYRLVPEDFAFERMCMRILIPRVVGSRPVSPSFVSLDRFNNLLAQKPFTVCVLPLEESLFSTRRRPIFKNNFLSDVWPVTELFPPPKPRLMSTSHAVITVIVIFTILNKTLCRISKGRTLPFPF